MGPGHPTAVFTELAHQAGQAKAGFCVGGQFQKETFDAKKPNVRM